MKLNFYIILQIILFILLGFFLGCLVESVPDRNMQNPSETSTMNNTSVDSLLQTMKRIEVHMVDTVYQDTLYLVDTLKIFYDQGYVIGTEYQKGIIPLSITANN